MVNNLGIWTFIPNTPKSEKCDMDYIAEFVIKTGYQPQTTLENLCEMIVLHYESQLEFDGRSYFDIEKNNNAPMINIDDVACYIEASGGMKEFDYEC